MRARVSPDSYSSSKPQTTWPYYNPEISQCELVGIQTGTADIEVSTIPGYILVHQEVRD